MEPTYAIAGHGLLLAPSPACFGMVTDDGALVLLQRNDDRVIARITPGDVPAHGDVTWLSPSVARFGDSGPWLELGHGVELEAAFLHIHTGMPAAKWSAIAVGMMMTLPVGVVLDPPQPGDDEPFFRLFAPSNDDQYISFYPNAGAAHEVEIEPSPDQQIINQGAWPLDGRNIRFTECAYEHDGDAWRQNFYVVPVEADDSVVIRVQAKEPTLKLFEAGQLTAKTLVPWETWLGQVTAGAKPHAVV